MKKRIVLLGPPASGKGTQAQMISLRFGLPVTSPGTILREEKQKGTILGNEADQLTAQGHLVPDWMVNNLVEGWLTGQGKAFVFDGYPRSLGQGSALETMLAKRQTPLGVVVLLEAGLNTIQERVRKRLVCLDCGQIVGVGLHVSDLNSVCPQCGHALTKRRDDTQETLALRMQEYQTKTEPLVQFYTERGLLAPVNSTAAPEVVHSKIVKILEEA